MSSDNKKPPIYAYKNMENLIDETNNNDGGVINSYRFIRSDRFRAWVDDKNTGHIKILKRVNFVTLITILKQIVLSQKYNNLTLSEIRVYIPGSLKTICSDNLRSVIEFTDCCCDLKIIVIISDDGEDARK